MNVFLEYFMIFYHEILNSCKKKEEKDVFKG